LDALVREVTGVDVSGVKGASGVGDIEAREGGGGEPTSSSSVASVAPNAALRLLVVDLRKMKAEDELKRLFGSRVVANVEAEENGRYSGRASALKQKLRSKTTFATFRDAWSTYRSEGIHMELCKDVSDPSTGMSEYAFVWKPEYEEAQFHFEVAVASHDPNRLFHLVRDYPWHLETILRISELYHYSGQAQESSEMLERCLYACERAWHPTFASAASNGLARLDSSLPANKPLFEALFRHVINLTRRGCQKTALDTAKFLLGLDHTDPKGVLCCIDYFALRCGEEHWLIDFAQTFGDSRYVGDGEWQSHGSLLSFPGFAYSYAMALYVTADDIADADAALLQAMLTHPYAWSAVLSKIEANDAETKEILAHEHFDFSNCALACRSLEHLSDVFATRHHALWKPEATMKWAKKVAKMAINLIDSTKPSPLLDGLTAADFTAITLESWLDGAENAYAHIIIDDFQDVVKRQLPEDDPLAQRQPVAGGDDDD
jgi:tetratricopeptide (TPR) repeat protein